MTTMRVSWRTEIPQWLLIGAMFVAAAVTWPTAPEQVPVHWNIAGQVDRYGGKVEGLLGIPLLTLALYVLLLALPRFDPGRRNYARFAGAYAVIRLGLVVVMAILQATILLWVRGTQVDVAAVVGSTIGVLLLMLGGVMGKIRPNWFVGIRTPWTLSSKRAWIKTHRLGGWLFILMGIATILAGWTRSEWTFGVMLAVLLLGSAWLVVYSYLVWRSDPDKHSPFGTVPAEEV